MTLKLPQFKILHEMTVSIVDGVKLDPPVTLKPGMYFIGRDDNRVHFVEVEEDRDDA